MLTITLHQSVTRRQNLIYRSPNTLTTVILHTLQAERMFYRDHLSWIYITDRSSRKGSSLKTPFSESWRKKWRSILSTVRNLTFTVRRRTPALPRTATSSPLTGMTTRMSWNWYGTNKTEVVLPNPTHHFFLLYYYTFLLYGVDNFGYVTGFSILFFAYTTPKYFQTFNFILWQNLNATP